MSFFAIPGVSLLVFATVALNDSSEILQDEIESSLNSIVEQKVSLIESYINEEKSFISLYSHLPEVGSAVSELVTTYGLGTDSPSFIETSQKFQSLLTRLKRESNSQNLFLISPKGDIIFTALNNRYLSSNLLAGSLKGSRLAEAFNNALLLKPIKLTKFEAYSPVENPDDGKTSREFEKQNNGNVEREFSAFMAAPVLINNTLQGVIAIQLDSKGYYHLSTDYSGLGNSGESVLGQLDGDYVEIIAPLRTNQKAAFSQKYKVGSKYAIPLQKAVAGRSGSGNMRDYSDTPIIAAWRHIPDLNWGIVVKIESSEAFERVRLLRNKFINIGIILLIAAGLLGYLLSNKIMTPIKRLLEFTLKVSSGELDRQLKVTSNDEVGHLTEAFNRMIKSRASYEKELEVTSQTVIQANKELVIANEASKEAVRAKGEFFASMSHEIRTPMNGVLGMLGLLENTKLTKEQRHRTSVAKSSAESLLTLINDILDYSKVDAGKIELEYLNFDLRKMIDEMAESLAHLAQSKGIELIIDLCGVDASTVKGDPGRIRQCITNLVSNAIKFTEKGEVVIRVHLTSLDDRRWSMNCAVNDTGIGIPEEKLKFLFDSFSQVDASTTRRFGGTGLGLAIVKKLAELMGGGVYVTSEMGVGSSFSFDIELEKSTRSKVVIPHFDISKLNILVIDDNETNREIFREQLSHWGASVHECRSGDDALDHLENLIKDDKPIYDVAILDMQMPNMDGAELGKKIKENSKLKDIKLVMMTSMAHQGDARFFANLGFCAYFPKPTTTEDLFHALSVVADDGDAMANAEPLVTHRYLNELHTSDEEDELSHEFNFSKSRMLLVEDNQVNQMVAKGILKKIGCSNVDVAADGNEAINSLQKTPEDAPYDVVLMDCQMPELDGYEATKRIRLGRGGERNKSIPIIAMTANAMQGDKERCLDAGMDDYLTKPIDIEKLKLKLTKWLAKTPNLD